MVNKIQRRIATTFKPLNVVCFDLGFTHLIETEAVRLARLGFAQV